MCARTAATSTAASRSTAQPVEQLATCAASAIASPTRRRGTNGRAAAVRGDGEVDDRRGGPRCDASDVAGDADDERRVRPFGQLDGPFEQRSRARSSSWPSSASPAQYQAKAANGLSVSPTSAEQTGGDLAGGVDVAGVGVREHLLADDRRAGRDVSPGGIADERVGEQASGRRRGGPRRGARLANVSTHVGRRPAGPRHAQGERSFDAHGHRFEVAEQPRRLGAQCPHRRRHRAGVAGVGGEDSLAPGRARRAGAAGSPRRRGSSEQAPGPLDLAGLEEVAERGRQFREGGVRLGDRRRARRARRDGPRARATRPSWRSAWRPATASRRPRMQPEARRRRHGGCRGGSSVRPEARHRANVGRAHPRRRRRRAGRGR